MIFVLKTGDGDSLLSMQAGELVAKVKPIFATLRKPNGEVYRAELGKTIETVLQSSKAFVEITSV